MFKQETKENSSMVQRGHSVIVASLFLAAVLSTSSWAQDSKHVESAEAEDESQATESSKSTEPKFDKDSIKKLSAEELGAEYSDYENLCAADRVIIRVEMDRREKENDRPVNLANIKKLNEQFGSVNPSEPTEEEEDAIPTLEEIKVTPPNSSAQPDQRVVIDTTDPRESRNRNRDKPPPSIPTVVPSRE